MTMSLKEIEDYLSDCNISEKQIPELARDIYLRLDPAPMHQQIDELLRQFAYAADYDQTLNH